MVSYFQILFDKYKQTFTCINDPKDTTVPFWLVTKGVSCDDTLYFISATPIVKSCLNVGILPVDENHKFMDEDILVNSIRVRKSVGGNVSENVCPVP